MTSRAEYVGLTLDEMKRNVEEGRKYVEGFIAAKNLAEKYAAWKNLGDMKSS